MKLFWLLLALASPAFAGGDQIGYVEISGGEKVFTRLHPAQNGAPTLVLLNGLTYSTEEWQAFTKSMLRLRPELGILRLDMKGMGRTLLAGPVPVNYEIPYTDQVKLLKEVLEALHLSKVNLVGFSYGGGIATAFAKAYPSFVEKLILMAPFTEALDDQDRLIRTQVAANRMAFPFNPASDDELYDFFLKQFIYALYPVAEPTVMDNPYKLEGIFRLAQGIRSYKVAPIVNQLPRASVHLIVANEDQYVPKRMLDSFWDSLPDYVRLSRINISITGHKMPETIPDFSAAWIHKILSGTVSYGKVFEGNTKTFEAVSGSTVIKLR